MKPKNNATGETRILIADDHQMFRAGIANLLAKEPGFVVVGQASEGNEAVRLAREIEPDIILMDVDLPGVNGIDASMRIMEQNPDTKILALSYFENEDYIMSMLRAGAKGYILKDAPIEDLLLAIRAICQGSSYFTQSISTKLFARLEHSEPAEDAKNQAKNILITSRELEILKFVSEELTSKEIAGKLFISQRTVETHRRNLIHKLNVKNTAGLVKYYLEHCTENENSANGNSE